MRFLLLLVACLALAGAALVAEHGSAQARCPEGTVFSAYYGHGICAYVGQGAKAKYQCTVRQGKCPSGTTREHSNSDPTRDYCCPKEKLDYVMSCRWVGTGPFCGGQCAPSEFEQATSAELCVSGHRAYCCHKVYK